MTFFGILIATFCCFQYCHGFFVSNATVQHTIMKERAEFYCSGSELFDICQWTGPNNKYKFRLYGSHTGSMLSWYNPTVKIKGDDVQLIYDNDTDRKGLTACKLTVARLLAEDLGKWTCKLTNSKNETATATINLTEPPELYAVNDGTDWVSTTEGNKAELSCIGSKEFEVCEWESKSGLKWTAHGNVTNASSGYAIDMIPSSNGTQTCRLTIANATRDLFQTWICTMTTKTNETASTSMRLGDWRDGLLRTATLEFTDRPYIKVYNLYGPEVKLFTPIGNESLRYDSCQWTSPKGHQWILFPNGTKTWTEHFHGDEFHLLKNSLYNETCYLLIANVGVEHEGQWNYTITNSKTNQTASGSVQVWDIREIREIGESLERERDLLEIKPYNDYVCEVYHAHEEMQIFKPYCEFAMRRNCILPTIWSDTYPRCNEAAALIYDREISIVKHYRRKIVKTHGGYERTHEALKRLKAFIGQKDVEK